MLQSSSTTNISASLSDPIVELDRDVGPRILKPAQAARVRAADAWLAQNFALAASRFDELANMEEHGSTAHINAVRLRGAALLRAKRFDEALAVAQEALRLLGHPAADLTTDKEFFDLVATGALQRLQAHAVVAVCLGRQLQDSGGSARASCMHPGLYQPATGQQRKQH